VTKLKSELLNQYIWQRQTYADLAQKYGRSKKWVQMKLDENEIDPVVRLNPKELVIVADTTFFSQANGLIVFREPNLKKNVWWSIVAHERTDSYLHGKNHLEQNGFKLAAVVLDGRQGIRAVFSDIPVQMCQFHQKQIIKRYLTAKPKLEASRELKAIVDKLVSINEQKFAAELNCWHERWNNFLKQKTANQNTGRWFYTHKRLRSAYRSLNTNLPYLFTYQKFPELNIPNTTNSLDGFFNRLKSLIFVHRGLSVQRRKRIIIEILKGRNN
jgi:hypothetical protein